MEKIFLASSSPRRAELLRGLGLDFTVCAPDADESSINKAIPINMYVQELALLKATAAAKELIGSRGVIIAADTVVCMDGEILGKPYDEQDAARILAALSGKSHEVYTGVCVMRISDGYAACESERTAVTFLPITEEKIDRYIKTGEPMDKAGAYGIQGLGAALVKKIEGDYFNVVGLPISKLTQLLEKEFDIHIF